MKIHTKLYVITGIILTFYSVTHANLLKDKAGTNSFPNQNAQTQQAKSDSLPEGVTQDWLNELLDENGNKIINQAKNETSGQIPEDPEGDSFQRKVFNGLNTGDNFGISVSNAGDVNGDGYDDIIIGAQNYSSSTGRAYIYYGGLIMNTVASVILTGGAANNYFGRSVSSAGDVNSDGYSDVIVGAYGYTSLIGRAYIYFGGSSMNNTADVTMTGEAANNLFGISVSAAGDVNSDGYSDVIVGASGYSSGLGRAYIFLGGASMNNTADVTMTGEAASNNFGYSVSEAGDVNGDGYSDVITGAYNYSSTTGRAYIYFGGAPMNNAFDVTMTGESAFSNFGQSVSAAGDVNGDGYSDVISGAFGYSSSTGRAYIFFGGASMNNTADVILTGESSGIQFGQSVSDAGDVNGDGYSDVIAGANNYNTFTGRVYIFFGGVSMDNSPDATITGESSGNQFGYSVSSAGDVNGDGYSDVIAGAWAYGTNTGRAYLYDYFMKGHIIPEITMTGETTNNYFGLSVSAAGDVNGDGFSDVIVGANGYSSNTGRAYIYFGGEILNNIPDVTMTGEATLNYFGKSVSTAGDVNGDGFSDVIVGAHSYGSNIGRAYLFYGGASMDNVTDGVMTGESAGSYFGTAVSAAGDVNGDGYSDWIVGAPGYSSSTGRAYIFYGGAFTNVVADVIMTGGATVNQFGISVSAAGDVDGDGYSDVIIGASSYNLNTGRAYVFFGGSSMDNAADVTMTGENTNDSFGFSVSGAGDINGDGYSDVIVGAPFYNSSTGRAYIFFGNVSINNTADVIFTGETVNTNFGVSVSSGGDINGDGFSDVIVGASDNNATTGRAYFFFGGISMNYDVTMSGEAQNNYFGFSGSLAGDVNGDGYSDVIVGARGNNSNTGRAYIYTGSAISINPVLNYVKDVPNDQGGKVNLKWTRSGYDVQGNSLITNYLVQRSFPPSGGNFSWQNVTTIPASHESFYTYIDFTPSDSTSNGSSTFFYRITARTNNINQSWRSNILSGRSLDNIAPPIVSPFTAASAGSNVMLNWNRSSASDLLNYVLFRSSNPTIDPYAETQWASVNDTTLIDTSPLSGAYYYFIVAQDIHNNYSPVAVTQSPNITVSVNLTMFVQGFYSSALDAMVSDTINVFLRNTSSPYALVDSATTVVSANGNAALNFINAPNGTYYLAITHRNSIETWSASGIAVTAGVPVNYNLSTSPTQAYGNNIKQIDLSPLRYGIYSGDVNQDGYIDLTDINRVFNDAGNFVTGYAVTDVNGDNIIDLTDMTIAYNNSSAFVSKMTP